MIERLYGCSHLLNDAGQYAYYGRVGGCLITGNEDGIKHSTLAAFREALPAGSYLAPACGARRVTPGGATG